jgi:hypothetical protein
MVEIAHVDGDELKLRPIAAPKVDERLVDIGDRPGLAGDGEPDLIVVLLAVRRRMMRHELSPLHDRNERRNITASMKAMAHAILSPDPEKLRRKGSGQSLLLGKDTSEGYALKLLSQARAVRKYAPTLVEKVRDGFPVFWGGARRPRLADRRAGPWPSPRPGRKKPKTLAIGLRSHP